MRHAKRSSGFPRRLPANCLAFLVWVLCVGLQPSWSLAVEPKEAEVEVVATELPATELPATVPPQSNLKSSQRVVNTPQLDTSSAIANMAVGLVAVILLILAISWGIKRFGGLPGQGGGQLAISATIAVGTRERISLVDVGQKRILVGITAQQISVLHVFDASELPEPDRSSEFSRKFQSLLAKGRTEKL